MKILFAHQNFPGQFKHICQTLAGKPGHELVFLSKTNPNRINGVRRVDYTVSREPAASTHHYIREYERGILYGQAAARAALELRKSGFKPDVMIGHNGWGETLFLKDVYPDVPLLAYFEFFYQATGADTGFDPAYPVTLDDRLRIRSKNSINLLGLDGADWGLSPTAWQRSRYPQVYRTKISQIHEGVDTELCKPNPSAYIELKSGRRLTAQDEVITYVARNLEPYRGFHIFMRAIPEICRRRPNATILIVGGDEVSYGRSLPNGETYRQRMLKEVTIDPSRVLFLGRIPYQHFVSLLQISSAHVYLTYPFVLSWSMLEAMSSGCLIVGSKTSPVEEVIVDGKNGLLVDFFSPDQVAARVDEALSDPERMRKIREAARRTIVERYDLRTRCLPQFLKLVDDLIQRRTPQLHADAGGQAKGTPAKPAKSPKPQRRGRG